MEVTDKVEDTPVTPVYTASLTIKGFSDGTVHVATDYDPSPESWGEVDDGDEVVVPSGYVAVGIGARAAVDFLKMRTQEDLSEMEVPSNAVN